MKAKAKFIKTLGAVIAALGISLFFLGHEIEQEIKLDQQILK